MDLQFGVFIQQEEKASEGRHSAVSTEASAIAAISPSIVFKMHKIYTSVYRPFLSTQSESEESLVLEDLCFRFCFFFFFSFFFFSFLFFRFLLVLRRRWRRRPDEEEEEEEELSESEEEVVSSSSCCSCWILEDRRRG